MRWSVGDKVRARWPGSALYFAAQIKSLSENEAEVLFDEGSIMQIPIKSIVVRILSILNYKQKVCNHLNFSEN